MLHWKHEDGTLLAMKPAEEKAVRWSLDRLTDKDLEACTVRASSSSSSGAIEIAP